MRCLIGQTLNVKLLKNPNTAYLKINKKEFRAGVLPFSGCPETLPPLLEIQR